MKVVIPFLFLFYLNIDAQDLELTGRARIGTMDVDNSADSMVVRLADGTLAIRAISTLPNSSKTNELQNLSEVIARDSSANGRIKTLKILKMQPQKLM